MSKNNTRLKETFTAYVTKYALTTGILEVVADWDEAVPEMISYKAPGSFCNQYAHKGDWWRDVDSARVRAETMRTKKIASLNKSIDKMIGLKVEVVRV